MNIRESVEKFVKVSGLTVSDLPTQKHVLGTEIKETFDAWADDDRIEQLDGLADTSFVSIVIHCLGSNQSEADHLHKQLVAMIKLLNVTEEQLELAVKKVCASNLSKFDRCNEEAVKTANSYARLGVLTTIRETDGYYATIVERTCVGTDGKEYRKGKVLKSINHYFNPDLEGILDDV